MDTDIYTVVELNNSIKDMLLLNFNDTIKVSGEISNMKISNGHLYSTLKQNDSAISMIFWSFASNNIKIENGDKVVAEGKISCFTKTGTYNITVKKITHMGAGDLNKIYDNLKKKCDKLGYFSDTTKKKLPEFINRVGILTAPEGAALQDVLYVFKKNNFNGTIVIKRCKVQGQSCPQSIEDGMQELLEWTDDQGKKLDVILITRGGGSFEDLMGFSDIKVIEAIYKSDIYTISAIGHEVDFMLSDYVADYRAPTPSISAEYISNNQKIVIATLNSNKIYFDDYVKSKIENKLNQYLNKFESYIYKLKNPTNEIDDNITKLSELKKSLENKISNILVSYTDNNKNLKNKFELYIYKLKNSTNEIDENITKLSEMKKTLDINMSDILINYAEKINSQRNKLEDHNIDKMLEAGYVLLLNRGYIYDSIKSLKIEQKLKLKFRDGEATIIIKDIS
jgi:exodeoxyribonuclease VII large subunit